MTAFGPKHQIARLKFLSAHERNADATLGDTGVGRDLIRPSGTFSTLWRRDNCCLSLLLWRRWREAPDEVPSILMPSPTSPAWSANSNSPSRHKSSRAKYGEGFLISAMGPALSAPHHAAQPWPHPKWGQRPVHAAQNHNGRACHSSGEFC